MSNSKFNSPRRHHDSHSTSMINSPFRHLKKSEPPENSPRFQRNRMISSGVLPSFGGGGNGIVSSGNPDMTRAQKSGEGSGSPSTNDQSNMGASNTLKGLTPIEALEQYDGELTAFEMTELTSYDVIYAVGSVRVSSLRQIANREGFYNAHVGEQLGYRYLVEKVIDAGAFG